jgi:tagatose-1,6-bisphosphate aldolase
MGGPIHTLTIGKLRGLQRIASARGTFTSLALDHRQNLRRALNPANPAAISDTELARFKLDVCAALAAEATSVLLDPQYSAAQALAAGVVPGHTGLVVALESTGYTGDPNARHAQILPGWSVEKAKRMGADAVKLLVYYHPESATAAEIEAFTKQVAGECKKHDLCLMLEPLSYPLDPATKKLSSPEKRHVVIETARRLTALGVDILKAEFPLDITEEQDEATWVQACAEISAASAVPWILLSAAAEYETYLRQVTAACQSGASGIAVGRAVWKQAVEMPSAQRSEFLQTVARQRLQQLVSLCQALARPWTEFYTAGEITPNWYETYAV